MWGEGGVLGTCISLKIYFSATLKITFKTKKLMLEKYYDPTEVPKSSE